MPLLNARRWVGLCVLVAVLFSPLHTVHAVCNPFKRADTNADGDASVFFARPTRSASALPSTRASSAISRGTTTVSPTSRARGSVLAKASARTSSGSSSRCAEQLTRETLREHVHRGAALL